MSIENGGPAFPSMSHVNDRGLSLRDYFAAMAMQALIMTKMPDEKRSLCPAGAYAYADAMLKARQS